jgi:hypothetical protein
MSFIAQADAQWAREVGRERSQQAWILSDRDVWYANPFYSGPPVPHPEHYSEDDDVTPEALAFYAADHGEHVVAWLLAEARASDPGFDEDDDIPF